MAATDVSVTEFKGNATNLVNAVKQIDTASKNLDSTLTSVLTHLKDIEKGLKNVNSITNNAKSVTNTINTKSNTNTFDVGTQAKIVKGSTGFMGSDTGREKAFKDYQQAVIEETREITADIAERKRRRKQRADAETTSANAAKLRATKLEDQTTDRYLDRMDKLAEAKLLNAKNGQVGTNLRSFRLQGARALSSIGNTVSGLGIGGRMAGYGLDMFANMLKSPAAGLTGIFSNLAKAIKDLGSEAVKAYTEIESIKTQLGIVFSSQTQANTAFREISQYAIHSPFGIEQTSELAVLLKQSGVYASDLMDTLRMLGDTAGGNMEKMKRIANNYAQIVSIGKASMLDMRQFAYAGIPIFEAVSKELGVSQQQLRKLISEGKVTSDIIEKVFKNLTGINGIFENATEVGAKTLKARLQNLKDATQLALASAGEELVKYGTDTGNDSFANYIVSGLEDLSQYIHDAIDTRNIERSVAAIEKRDLRIQELQKAMEDYSDNPKMLALFSRALGVELNKVNIESDRAAYEASYQNKTKMSQETYSSFGVKNFDELKQLAEIINPETKRIFLTGGTRAEQESLYADEVVKTMREAAESLGMSMTEVKDIFNLSKDEFKELSGSLADAIDKMEKLREVTELEIKYHLETNLLNAQQLAFDQENKRAEASGSLNSSFQELLEIYKSSDEYKEKEEKERIEALKQAQELLKKLLVKVDENGLVDMTKFGVAEFLNYDKQGAFAAGRKLDVVNGKNTSIINEDTDLLKKQFGYAIKETINFFNNSGDKLTAATLTNAISRLNGNLSNSEYLDKFSGVMNDIKNIISSSSLEESVKQLYQSFIYASTLQHEVTVGGENATPEDIAKGAGQEFIPLWKRILAQYTGLTAQGMTSTAQTLGNYQNDMAIRNMASDVLKATFSSVGLGSAMSLMKAGELKQLRGDTGGTYQIDWQESKKAMHDFAMQLSASTEVISAYKKGLEDELATYQELVAAGYTQAESQDIKNQKTVSTKKMSQLVMDAGEQLVNAFGEKFETASGKAAYLREDGLFYDEKGVQIQEEELRLTGNLFRMIETRLDQLYSEIHEANARQLNNQAMEELLKNIAPTAYSSKVLNSGGDPRYIAYAMNNSEYVQKFLDTEIEKLKNSGEYGKKTESRSTSDILLEAINNEERIKELTLRIQDLETKKSTLEESGLDSELLEEQIDYLHRTMFKLSHSTDLVNDAFSALEENVSDLIDNEEYAEGYEKLKKITKTNALNTAVAGLLGAYSVENIPESQKNIPENYGGLRGDRNFLYKALGWNSDLFDKEDLYFEAAKSGYWKNDNGENKYIDLEKLDAEGFADILEDADKKAIDLAYHFEELNNTIKDLAANLIKSVDDFAQGTWLAPFEQLGEYLVTDEDYAEGFGNRMKQLGAEMISQMGTYMARAGFSLVVMGAQMLNPGLVAGGLALAAAGGFASGLGGALREGENNKDKSDKETQRLEALKNDLQKLLEQARTDALYYENNLRHQTAVGTNKQFSYKSVHDAVITPRGVVETDPKDFLIATKTPQQFMGNGNVTVSPVINCNVVNNTNARVRQEQTQNADGSIDIVTIIEEVTGDYISSPRSDDAFAARNYRLNGRQSIM